MRLELSAIRGRPSCKPGYRSSAPRGSELSQCLQKSFDPLQAPSGGLVLCCFPALPGSRVHSDPESQLPLRQPQHLSRGNEPVSECLGGRKRVIPEKLEDGRDVTDCRGGCVAFPVANGRRVDTDLLGNLFLEEISVHPTAPEVVAQATDFLGIAFGLRSRGEKLGMAERQHMGEGRPSRST